MRLITAKILLIALGTVTALPLLPAADAARGVAFSVALWEKDNLKRIGLLLNVAERGGHQSELALRYLLREPELPPVYRERIIRLAENSGDKLFPVVLLCRSGERTKWANQRFCDTWLRYCNSKLSNFERKYFRELSGVVLEFAQRSDRCHEVRRELEKFVLSHPGDWKQTIPVYAVMDFYYTLGFRASGYELFAPKWGTSKIAECKAFHRLVDESIKYTPADFNELNGIVNVYFKIGFGKLAMNLVFRNIQDEKFFEWTGLMLSTAERSGSYHVIEDLKAILKPAVMVSSKATAFINAGRIPDAEKLLPEISDFALRERVKLRIFMAKGEYHRLAEILLQKNAPFTVEEKVGFLLMAAHNGGEKRYIRQAESLMTPEMWKKPGNANDFGYTLLMMNLDTERAGELIRFALKSDLSNKNYLDSMAMLWCKRGDYREAWRWMEQALKLLKPSAEACEILEHAGDIRLALGDRKQAEAFYRAGLRIAWRGEPLLAAYYQHRAKVLEKKLEKCR